MRPVTLFLCSFVSLVSLSPFTSATRLTSFSYVEHGLRVRQTTAFQPGTTDGDGDSCADAFGEGYVTCGTETDCYNPSAGESCCQASDPYACPSTSYCLADGYCCPKGLNVTECAIINAVSLPANFTTDAISATSVAMSATSAATATAAGTGNATATATRLAAALTTIYPNSTFTNATSPVPSYPSPSSNGTLSNGTLSYTSILSATATDYATANAVATDTTTATASAMVEYTGAANHKAAAARVVALGVVGVAFVIL